ncbi:MAG TPA: oxygenase MpaB family protein [Actinomycetota bacterium]|jgi:hypothetical protein|nr:oxygenase MpaB family protein [Actinomycetota bacterium]
MDWTNAVLDGLRAVGDPEVDDMVGRYLQTGPTRPTDLLSRMIRWDPTPQEERSPEIDGWLDASPPLPSWVEPPLMDRGVEFFAENGPEILLTLLLASLPECYAARKGVQVLHLTARLVSNPQRRLVETAQMVIDAMSPDGLKPGRRGYETSRRVRLMHSGIRWLIQNDPNVIKTTDPAETRPHYSHEWGVPVNQEDLLGTMMTFSIVVLDSLEKMGIGVDQKDAVAYHHTWNVIGHLVGIRPDLLPISLDDGRKLVDLIRTRQIAPSKEGREMTAAALDFAKHAVRIPVLHGLPATTMRYLVGDHIANVIDVPPADWTMMMMGPISQFNRWLSFLEQRKYLLRLVTADFNRRLIEACLVVGRGGRRPEFEIPTHLADKWGLQRVVVSV